MNTLLTGLYLFTSLFITALLTETRGDAQKILLLVFLSMSCLAASYGLRDMLREIVKDIKK